MTKNKWSLHRRDMLGAVGSALLVVQLIINSASGQASSSGSISPVVSVFLNDSVFALNSTRPNPVDLGSFPYQCVGNIELCINGFTIGLWYRPSPGNFSNPSHYVLSTGAQNALTSSGVYFRQNYGEEHEIAVAIESRIWSVKFYLSAIGSWTHVAFTYNSNQGLIVYVDGLAVGSDPDGKTRVFSVSQFDQFTDIVVGQANDVKISTSLPGVAVWRITHVDTSYQPADIQSLVASVSNALWLGCSRQSATPTGTFSQTSTGSEASLAQCRAACHQQKLSIAVYQQATSCMCIDYAAWLAAAPSNAMWLASVCTGTETYLVTWSTHVLFSAPSTPINLAVTATNPTTTRNYVMPGETITFQISSSDVKPVTYTITFGDGSAPVVTTGSTVGYSWAFGGQYTVNVTATTRSDIQSVAVTVQIQSVAVGSAPDNLEVKADWDGVHNYGVKTYMEAYSVAHQSCTVNYGDSSSSEIYQVTGTLFSVDGNHTYPGLGLYQMTLSCSNQFGASNVNALIPSVQSGVSRENHASGTDVVIAIAGATSQLVQVSIDGQAAPTSSLTFNATHLTISSTQFHSIGEHSVTVTKMPSGLTLLTKVYDVLRPINGVRLTTSSSGVELSQPTNLVLTIQQGDDIFVQLSYGDGTSEAVYLAGSPATVTRTHTYTVLGPYTVTATVVNDVSNMAVTTVASVERRLASVVMAATNVTSLGVPTTFSFAIDTNVVPQMPVSVTFNYDDGNTATVQIVAPYVSTYTYAKYGIYRVSATVGNNISSISLPVAVIQVGENLTDIDVYVASRVVAVNQPVSLSIECPTGSPVALEVDMGDGQPPLKLMRPVNYSPSTDERVYPVPAVSASGNSTGNVRRRRQTGPLASVSSVGTPFNVTYLYTKTGRYSVSVKATNALSSTTSHLCPDVFVINPMSSTTCQLSVNVVNPAPFANPSTTMRSNVFSVTARAQVQCNSASLQPLYTWNVERLISGGKWRPELSVCVSSSSSPTLSVPSNTLWYGTYRVNVTVTASSDSSTPATLDRSPPASTYLTVIPSPLVANVSLNGSSSEFYGNATVWLDMSPTSDPDVDVGNDTGLNLHLFCYPLKSAAIYGAMNMTTLLSGSTQLAANIHRNAAVYQFTRNPCFINSTGTEWLWVMDFEVHFPSNYLISDDEVVFVLFAVKDTRMAMDNETVQSNPFGSANMSAALDNIDALLKSNNTGAALAAMNYVTNQLNSGSDDPDAVQARTALRGRLIGALGSVSNNLASMDQVKSTANVFSGVVSKAGEVSENGKAGAATAVDATASKALAMGHSVDAGAVTDITLSMMNGIGNILPFAPTENATNATFGTTAAPTTTASYLTTGSPVAANWTGPLCCENITVGLCDWIEPVGWMCVSEDDRKKTVWSQADCLLIYPDDMNTYTRRFNAYNDYLRRQANALKKTMTTKGLGALDSMGGLLLNKQSDNQNGSNLSTPNLNMAVQKASPGKPLKTDGFSIPEDQRAAIENGGGFQTVSAQNPYTYSDTSGNGVNGKVLSLSLTGPDGKPLPVNNAAKPFELWFDANPVEPAFSTDPLYGGNFTYHVVNTTDNGTALMAVIVPQEGITLSIYLKKGNYSNSTFYDDVQMIPNPSSGRNPYFYMAAQNATYFNGTYYIGIKVNSTSKGLDISASNYTYKIYFFSASCRFWNETTDSWDTSGCQVGPNSTALKTQCLCTHLTSFGGGCAVPPNTIDFSKVFSLENFLESMPVFCTVIAMIILWLLICIWARRMDKKDIIRWGAVPLEDNVPSDCYYYQLMVYTGIMRNAGTESKPSFILSGDDGDTGVRVLSDGKTKEIGTGSIKNYVMSVEDNLGPLTFLRIWHDNSGHGKKRGWFLDQVHITDLQTGEKFYFVCNRWMAVEEDDGQIERIIPVAGINDLTQFNAMFAQSMRKKFTEDHMWASIFSRPTRSSFTRVQRISSCVALLFLTMIVNCMFFKSGEPDHSTQIHIGPITLTPQMIFISVVSTLIVFPPSAIIVTIFRKVRPKDNTIQSEKTVRASNKPGVWLSINPGSSLWKNGEGVDRQTRMQKMRDAMSKITSFHKKKYAEDNEENQEVKTGAPPRKKPFSLPPWTIYIAWTLVVLTIIVSGFFTILYSMSWGRTKSLDWMQTFFLSFFQNVIIAQPLKVLLLATLISCILKKPDLDDGEGGSNALKPDEEFMGSEVTRSQQDIQAILKRRRASQPGGAGLGLPSQAQLKEQRELRLKQIEMDAIIREVVIYILFVLVVYFVSFQDRDQRSFFFNQNIQNQFFTSPAPNGSFTNINTYADVYQWVNNTLFPNLYSYGWYNGQPAESWKDMQQMNDHVTIRLGIGRLRQLRIKENTCTIAGIMKPYINHCRNDYSWMDDDVKSYRPNWESLSTSNLSAECLAYEKPFDPWRYRDAIELRGTPYAGQINTYKGGGYAFNFRRDGRTTQLKFNELAETNWLDVRTRALFVEFTLYNGNANLFASVVMLVEFLATGGPIFTQEVKVFRLSSYVGGFGAMVALFQAIFVCFVIYFTYHCISMIRKQKCQYFKSFWNLHEFSTLFVSILAIVMYAMKFIIGNTAMTVLKEAGTGDYVNFVSIATWAEIYCYLLAFVVFMATLKFINMLKFNRRMGLLTETIKASVDDMKGFSITFFIYIMAFAMFAFLLFGTQMAAFGSFGSTISSLFLFVLGQYDFVSMQIAQPFLGPVFFFLFIFMVFFGLQAMFLTIIIEAFETVRQDVNKQKNDYEVFDYILGKFKNILSVITGDNYGDTSLKAGAARGKPKAAVEEESGAAQQRNASNPDREVAEGNVEIGLH